jgi:hypothetical protein
MFFRRRKNARRSGGPLLVAVTLMTCLLLIANRVLAGSLYHAIVPADLDIPKARTIISVLAMIGLLLPEWWLIDRILGKLKAAYRWLEAAQRTPDS